MIRLTALFVAMTVFLLVTPTDAEAKKRRRRVVITHQQYVIPFTCGNNAMDVSNALPGDYAIAIDVLNAGGADITLDEQIHLTFPPGNQMPSHVSDHVTIVLTAETAMQISCDDLLGSGFVYANPPAATTYVQGLLLLTASSPVHVSATRTAQGAGGDLTMQTEKVQSVGVRPIAQDPSGKILVCHAPPGNPGNAHTISVGMSSWPAHQGHGDSQGACNP